MFKFVQWKISSFICMFIPIYCPDFYHSKRKGFFSSFFSIEGRVNYAFDQLMEWLRKHFRESGYDPYKLSDQVIWNSPLEFPQGTEWKNTFEFYNGAMHNLSTLHRIHDAKLEYSPFCNQFELRAYIAFDHIRIIYDFAAKLMNLGPRGKLVAHIPSMRAKFRIAFKADSGYIRTELKEFAIEDTKDVRFSAEGFGPLNSLVVSAAKGTLQLLSYDYKDALLRTVEKRLRENLEMALQAYDQYDIGRGLGRGDGRGDEREEGEAKDKKEGGKDGKRDKRDLTKIFRGKGDATGEERKGTDDKEGKKNTEYCLLRKRDKNKCKDECESDQTIEEDSKTGHNVDVKDTITILNEFKKSVLDFINTCRRQKP